MYWLTQFGEMELPQYDVEFSNAPAPAPVTVVELVGPGTFDADGEGIAQQRWPHMLSYRCLVAGQMFSEPFGVLANLKARLGRRDKLWRASASPGAAVDQWAWARLVQVDDTMRTRGPRWMAPVVLTFALLGPWHGLDHEDTTTLSTAYTAPQTIAVVNNGNQAVREIVIKLTAAGSDNTYLAVSVAGVSAFSWSGTLQAGKTLVIDAGKRSVINDGVDAYAGFTLEAEHVVADWLVLEPGSNNVVVRTESGGPNSTITFEFADGWA